MCLRDETVCNHGTGSGLTSEARTQLCGTAGVRIGSRRRCRGAQPSRQHQRGAYDKQWPLHEDSFPQRVVKRPYCGAAAIATRATFSCDIAYSGHETAAGAPAGRPTAHILSPPPERGALGRTQTGRPRITGWAASPTCSLAAPEQEGPVHLGLDPARLAPSKRLDEHHELGPCVEDILDREPPVESLDVLLGPSFDRLSSLDGGGRRPPRVLDPFGVGGKEFVDHLGVGGWVRSFDDGCPPPHHLHVLLRHRYSALPAALSARFRSAARKAASGSLWLVRRVIRPWRSSATKPATYSTLTLVPRPRALTRPITTTRSSR